MEARGGEQEEAFAEAGIEGVEAGLVVCEGVEVGDEEGVDVGHCCVAGAGVSGSRGGWMDRSRDGNESAVADAERMDRWPSG